MERDRRGLHEGCLAAVWRYEGDAGRDVVAPAGETAQHGPGVLGVPGLAEDGAIGPDDGVGGKHHVIHGSCHAIPTGVRLAPCQPHHELTWRLVLPARLVDVHWAHDGCDADPPQQLAAPG